MAGGGPLVPQLERLRHFDPALPEVEHMQHIGVADGHQVSLTDISELLAAAGTAAGGTSLARKRSCSTGRPPGSVAWTCTPARPSSCTSPCAEPTAIMRWMGS